MHHQSEKSHTQHQQSPGGHQRHGTHNAVQRAAHRQPPHDHHADTHSPPLRTPFSIIAILSEQRGREIVDMLGEHGEDLMAAALSLDQRGITCRRVLDLLEDPELRSVAAMWLPLDVKIPPIGREELISILCDLAHD